MVGEAPPAEPLLDVGDIPLAVAALNDPLLVAVKIPLEPDVEMMPSGPIRLVVDAPLERAARLVDVPDAVPVADAEEVVDEHDSEFAVTVSACCAM